METFYKERGALGAAPPDLEIFEVALLIKKTPDKVRKMAFRDVRWLKLVKTAQNLAFGPDLE